MSIGLTVFLQWAVLTKLVYSLVAMTVFIVLSNTVSTEDCWGELLKYKIATGPTIGFLCIQLSVCG